MKRKSLFRNPVAVVWICLLLLSAYGCGSSADAPTSSSVVVTPSLGLIVGADVTLTKPDGTQLGLTVRTDSTGKATVTFSGYSGPLLVEVAGNLTATYFDEALGSNASFGAGERLRAALDSVKSQVGVTALTDIALQRAVAVAGSTAALTGGAIQAANEAIRLALASEIADITAPPKLVSAGTALGELDASDASKYAAKLAAFAILAKDKSAGELTPALAIAKQLAEDLKDGVLDGKNGSAAVSGTGTYTPAALAAELKSRIATYAGTFGNAALQTLASGDTLSTIVSNLDHAGSGSSGASGADTIAPTVTAFAIPATSTSLTVTITAFTATDAVGITGYLVTESAGAPAASAAGWTASAPASYPFTTEGSKTLYGWAKDAAGNVSASRSAAVAITLGGGSSGGPVAGLMGGAIQSAALPGLASSAGSTVSTFAGNAMASPSITNTATGPATLARFVTPLGVTTDGTNLYVAELGDSTIRKIVIDTGVVSTLGSNVGSALTTDGTSLYVTSYSENVVRKVDLSSGAVTILAGSLGTSVSADGTGTAATFFSPGAITTDNTNLYVSDYQKIRKIVIATGVVTTLVNNVNGTFAPTYGGGASVNLFGNLAGALTTDGTYLYLLLDYCILRIDIQSRATTILAGGTQSGSSNGTGANARFNFPQGITSDGTYLYVSDYTNQIIRKVAIATGAVTTIAGSLGVAGQTEGAGSGAKFYNPVGITTNGAKLFIADSWNNTIRAIQ